MTVRVPQKHTMSALLVIGNRNYSSWSLRAWLLLREAGIAFEERRIALDQPGTRAALDAVSPSGRVPVLLLDGETIWDSLAIAETVAERYPGKRLWPADAGARAHARCISAEMHAGFAALRNQMPMNCRATGRKVPRPADLAADIDRVIAIWTDCQRRYGGGWLFGEFSVADVMYAPVVMRFRTYDVHWPDMASSYPERLLESPALQEWLAAAELETEVIEHDEKGHRAHA
jgi:glutathione S-transferase